MYKNFMDFMDEWGFPVLLLAMFGMFVTFAIITKIGACPA